MVNDTKKMSRGTPGRIIFSLLFINPDQRTQTFYKHIQFETFHLHSLYNATDIRRVYKATI
jgi:hypothetical protein